MDWNPAERQQDEPADILGDEGYRPLEQSPVQASFIQIPELLRDQILVSGHVSCEQWDEMRPMNGMVGQEARVYPHFGSAPCFLIFDTETGESRMIDNGNSHHEHGTCQPAAALSDYAVDVVVCSGMGVRALTRMNAAGIRVYRAPGETPVEVVSSFEKGLAIELTTDDACTDHHCH